MTPLRRTVLVVEDELGTAALLAEYLATYGYLAEIRHSGDAALAYVTRTPPSLILLDLNLPGFDGLEVCRRIRRFCDVPIIMLTARIDEADRLTGLGLGADDYVSKPFSPREVMARVAAAIRRAEGKVLDGNAQPQWHIDDGAQLIRFDRTLLTLTAVEFRILAVLLRQPGRIFTRDQLLNHAHPDQRAVGDRAIDTHIKNLRRKIVRAGASMDAIGTIYGVGYRFDGPSPVPAPSRS